jgi:NitT/TauT family transport system substrate-binding protein
MRRGIIALTIASTLLLAGCRRRSDSGAVSEIRITRQYGLAYLPLTLIEQQHLLEKTARAEGLGDVKVTWVQLGSGAASNDALLSGSVDFVSMGAPPMINAWAKTNGQVKAVIALGSAPVFLTTTNPNIKSIRDFSQNDRIALPAVKVSLQATILQMAVAQTLGDSHYADLDPLTVSMKPPDGMAAMLSGKSEITAHFCGEPFAYRELADPHIHEVRNSYDVLGGPHASVLIATTKDYHDKYPRVTKALLTALDEAEKVIRDDKRAAAQAMITSGDTSEPIETVLQRINDPRFRFKTEASDVTRFSDFMFKTGAINHKPADWRELFFPDAFIGTGN